MICDARGIKGKELRDGVPRGQVTAHGSGKGSSYQISK